MTTVSPLRGTTSRAERAGRPDGAATEPTYHPVRLTRRGRRLLGAAPAVLLVLGWLLLTIGNRWFVNPDGVVYAALTARIAAGDLTGAVTGYWSPLLPVLAAPWVLLGVSPLFALRLVLLCAALMALPIVHLLCRRACGSGPVALFCTVLAVPLLLGASVFGLYPELLLAVALSSCCALVLTSPGRSVGRAVAAGVAGGLGYLAKPVGLPFVVGFVLIVLAARLVAEHRTRRLGPGGGDTVRLLLRFHLIVLAGTALVAAPWVVAISVHVGHPTWSTSGAFNAQLVTPGAWGNPLSFPGLHRPVPPAMTPWEDPSLLSVSHVSADRGRPVTVLDRAANAVRQAEIAAGALLRRWTPVLLLALVGLVSTLRRHGLGRGVDPASEVSRRLVLGGVLGALLFAAGMSLIVVVERYLWFPMLALLPAAAVGVRVLLSWWSTSTCRDLVGRRFRPSRALAGLAALLVALVAASSAPVALTHWNQDRAVWSLASRLNATEPLTGGLAGNRDWERSQLLAYLCGVHYLGLTGPDQRPSAQAAQLQAVDGRHLVVWDGAGHGRQPEDGGEVFDLVEDSLRQHTAR